MWKEPQQDRTNADEIIQFIKDDKLILAYASDSLEEPAASIFFTTRQVEDKKHGELGMLAAKVEFTGKGVGRLLIGTCEDKARKEGCTALQLELLEPSEW